MTIPTVDCEITHFAQKSVILLSNVCLAKVSFYIKIKRTYYIV